jgi:hypothetical protein
MGMWKAGINKQLAWFLAIFTIPTIGILSLIYVLFIKPTIKPVNQV